MDNLKTKSDDLPFALRFSVDHEPVVESTTGFRSGDLCPACLSGQLKITGLLNLACEHCSYTVVGCFT